MAKRLLVLLSFITCFTIAEASTDPHNVDPEKAKKAKQEKAPAKDKAISNEITEDYRAFKAKDDIVPYAEAPENSKPVVENKEDQKEPAAAKPESSDSGDEVQSFNFLYYIIHHFKFSDFITE